MTPPNEERREGWLELRDNVKSILKILNGNGRVGMTAKVNLMWGWGRLVCGTIVGAVIVQTVIAVISFAIKKS